MSTQTRISIDAARATGILNSRLPINRADVGQQLVLSIQGEGTFQSAAEQEKRNPGRKQYFDQYIHNLKANSQEAMSRPENKKLLTEALKAESAGEVDKASDLFNEYLNNVQVSFSIIARPGMRKFQSGDKVKVTIAEAETKGGHRALVATEVVYQAPVVKEKVSFNLTDLIEAPEVAEEALKNENAMS